VRSHTLTNDGTFPHNTSGGQLSVGQAGRGRGLSRAGRGHASAHVAAAWFAGAQCQCLPSFRIRHDQLRSGPVILRCRSCESRVTEPLVRPRRKKSAQADTAAAAPARRAQPHRAWAHRCGGRGALRIADLSGLRHRHLPPTRRLSVMLVGAHSIPRRGSRWHAHRRNGRADDDRSLFSRAHALAGGDRETRCRPGRRAHLHGDAVEGGRVRLELKLDKSGSAVAIALPEKDTRTWLMIRICVK